MTFRAGPNQSLRMVRKPNYLHPGPPCGIKILKGIKNGAFTRQFVDFALGNRFAQDLYGWIYDTGHPCEHFMATLATLSTSPHSSSPETLNVFQSFHAIVRREKETGVWENRRYTTGTVSDQTFHDCLVSISVGLQNVCAGQKLLLRDERY